MNWFDGGGHPDRDLRRLRARERLSADARPGPQQLAGTVVGHHRHGGAGLGRGRLPESATPHRGGRRQRHRHASALVAAGITLIDFDRRPAIRHNRAAGRPASSGPRTTTSCACTT
ncbi:MAG: hypothetical protein MZV63_21555 [Marinilabiliales bacterium]|nr:hypothetical protein [Marinilabiliales bacterium]